MAISEQEQETIKKETRKLLEEFSKALEKIKAEKENNVEREVERRKDGDGKEALSEESDFRKIILENAAIKDENFIIAEKKSW